MKILNSMIFVSLLTLITLDLGAQNKSEKQVSGVYVYQGSKDEVDCCKVYDKKAWCLSCTPEEAKIGFEFNLNELLLSEREKNLLRKEIIDIKFLIAKKKWFMKDVQEKDCWIHYHKLLLFLTSLRTELAALMDEFNIIKFSYFNKNKGQDSKEVININSIMNDIEKYGNQITDEFSSTFDLFLEKTGLERCR